jgi:hypothetical protein
LRSPPAALAYAPAKTLDLERVEVFPPGLGQCQGRIVLLPLIGLAGLHLVEEERHALRLAVARERATRVLPRRGGDRCPRARHVDDRDGPAIDREILDPAGERRPGPAGDQRCEQAWVGLLGVPGDPARVVDAEKDERGVVERPVRHAGDGIDEIAVRRRALELHTELFACRDPLPQLVLGHSDKQYTGEATQVPPVIG